MTVTAQQVKELREKTGAGMMDAKKALVEADGDMEKAMEVLRQRGMATADKKAGRAAAEGLVEALIADDKQSGVLVEVNCETDFVARGDAFTAMAKEVAEQVFKQPADNVEALYKQASLFLQGKTVEEYVTDKIGSIKENIKVRRFVAYNVQGEGMVHSYIHTGGKIGVLIEMGASKAETTSKEEFLQLAKDVSMQIASFSAEFTTRAEIPQEVIDEETRIEMGKEDILSKPEEIREKIVTGRVDKLLAQRVLVEQEFVKDTSKKVGELVKEVGQQLGDDGVEIRRFTRYVLGEGVEKNETNFADEVAAAVAGG